MNFPNLGLLTKLLKFCRKSKNYNDSWFSNYFKRCSYCSYTGDKIKKTEKPFSIKYYEYPNIFKAKKEPQGCLDHEVIDMLCKIFEIEDDERFRKALLYQKNLINCSETHLRNTAQYLREINITEEHIIFAPGILLFKKDDIEDKRPLIESCYLFKNIRDGLGFVSFRSKMIKRYAKQFEEEQEKFGPFRNRIYYIGGKLNLPIDFLTLKIVKEWRILSLEKRSLDLFIDLFLEFKCRPMAIVNDLDIFFRNYDTTKKRLNEVSQLKGYPPRRLWWCFSSDKIYKRFYERAKKYENCFVDDVLQILKENLELSEEDALEFISKGDLERITPKVLHFRIQKYMEEGFTKDAFLKAPHMFNFSEGLILKRVQILKEKGLFKYARFYILGSNDNYFNERVKVLQILKEKTEGSVFK